MVSQCLILELVLKQRACISLVLVRGGALGLSGLPDHTLGHGPEFSVVVEFPQGHTWSSKACRVAVGPQVQCSDPGRRGSLCRGPGHGESVGSIDIIPADGRGLLDLCKWLEKLLFVLQL